MNETMAPCAQWWTTRLIAFRNAGWSVTASPASAVRSVARNTCRPSAARTVISARRVRPSEWRHLWSGLLARSSKRFLTGSWCGPSLKSFGPLSEAIESFWGNSAVSLGKAGGQSPSQDHPAGTVGITGGSLTPKENYFGPLITEESIILPVISLILSFLSA